MAVLLVAAGVALSRNTTWGGHLETERVVGFLRDLCAALLLSVLVLLLLAWLRTRPWRRTPQPVEPFAALPWTDRWLRDWRDAASRHEAAPEQTTTCRHGRPLAEPVRTGQPPALMALAVSQPVVRPGGTVQISWCFDNATDVDVDGRPGHAACGEALVRIDTSRRVEVIGRNTWATTPVATPTVVALGTGELHLPTVAAPPPVALRTDVAVTAAVPPSVAGQLDEFWATTDRLRPRLDASPSLVGVPASVIDDLRRFRRANGKG